MLTTILTWLGEAALLATFGAGALLSLMIATWWGELAGIRPHRDKSGLGGFAAMYLFCGMRWSLLAPVVACGSAARLPGHWANWLLVHLLLGIVHMRLFARGIEVVQQDRLVPSWLGIAGAVLVPAPALWLGCDVVVPSGHAAHIAVALLLLVQTTAFWRRRRERFRPEPPPPPSEVVDTDRGGGRVP